MVVNPEDVLMASGMELGSAVAFLYEHYPSFVHHDAMEDAAAAAGYFSEAGAPRLADMCVKAATCPTDLQTGILTFPRR